MNNYIDEITKLAITEQEKATIDIIFSIYNNEYIDYNDYVEHSKKLLAERENNVFYSYIPLLREELFNYIRSKGA